MDNGYYHNEKHFQHPKVIHNDLTLGMPSLRDPSDRIGSNLDKMAIDKLAGIASSLENSVKHQNIELKNEIKELRQQIANLTQGGKINQNTEYDSIHWRLNRIKDEDDTRTYQPTNFQLLYHGIRNPVPVNSHANAYSNRSFNTKSPDPRERLRQFNSRAQANYHLQKRYRGMKRDIRTGEEPLPRRRFQ